MNVANIITARFDRWRTIMAGILDRFGYYMSVDDIYKQCSACQKLFFDNDEAFAVVNVVEHPKDTHLFILLAGGTPAGFAKLDPIIYRFGQQIGATKASFIGRKGLAKVMAKQGWKSPFIYMEKEIL